MNKLRTLISRFTTWFHVTSFDRMAKKSNNILLLAWRTCIALLIIWAVWRFNNFTENDSYVIRAFSVPPRMEQTGYKGETVVAKIISEMMQIMYPKDSSTSSPCSNNRAGWLIRR